jgi:hypothetical protein
MVLNPKSHRHCEERQRRGNLLVTDPTGQGDCFAALIAMDGMYAENAGAFFCRNDVFW